MKKKTYQTEILKSYKRKTNRFIPRSDKSQAGQQTDKDTGEKGG